MTQEGYGVDPAALLEWVRAHRDPFVSFLSALVEAESPTDDPGSQRAVQGLLTDALEGVAYRVTRHAGRATGGLLLARPPARRKGRPLQMVVGHTDTVWPRGTLAEMSLRVEGGQLYGPGAFDMKAGLAQVVFAVRALRELDVEPAATPVLLFNSDEEVGSPESRRTIGLLARRSCRAFIPEPAFGPRGLVKTARKGMVGYTVHIHGRAAHAGLDPGGGASAIQELASVVRRLHALTDLASGLTVNVGVVEGGTRPNVVAARARAEVDVRVVTEEEGRRMAKVMAGLAAETPGVRLTVEEVSRVPPLERTPRNRRLFQQAQAAGRALGFGLEETMVGGGSDGNTTSRYTATLDGLGAVGDGAHAAHEHVAVGPTLERCALLALLLASPVDGGEG